MKIPYNRKERLLIRSVKSQILKTYSGRLDKDFVMHIRNIFTFFDYPREAEDILKLCNKKKVDFLNLFRDRIHFSCDLSFESLLENPRSFILITDFGGSNRNTYLHEGCSYLYLAFNVIPKNERVLKSYLYRNIYRERDAHNLPYQVRSYQLLSLYCHYRSSRDHPPSDYEVVLRVLWSSIPDPLLTYAEFTTTFKWIDIRHVPLLQTAWSWYCALIRGPDDEGKCPRSLKHLARCTVRDSLRSGFQLPYGVEKLAIPKSLKQYLLLKDFETELKSQRQIKNGEDREKHRQNLS